MKTPATLRKHAQLIRATADRRNDDERDMAYAYAYSLEAEADLQDALAGDESGVAEHATTTQDCPIIGRITISGGEAISIEREWTTEHNEAARAHDMMVSFEWCRSLHTPDAGRLIRIYIGTRTSGPLAMWYANEHGDEGAYWMALKSKGNYGKNWSSGGNFCDAYLMQECPSSARRVRNHTLFDSLESCRPELAEIIKNLTEKMKGKEDRINIAKAKIEASKLRILAASNRSRVASYNRQSANPIYPGQDIVCICKAAETAAYADKQEALAELILAEAGV